MDKSKGKRKLDNEFEEWGNYMNAKISKLEAQYEEEKVAIAIKNEAVSNIFKGIAIFVNGYTEPSADELRCLMLLHGGVFHHYFRPTKTTHIIASVLPNVKFDQMKTLKVVKSTWIIESIKAMKLLDYKNYLLINEFPEVAPKTDILSRFKNLPLPSVIKDLEVPKTAVDKNYLSEFYSNSRLHYISTLGSMLKQHVAELRLADIRIFPGRKKLQELFQEQPEVNSILSYDKVIMHVDMDCFFVSVSLINYPCLRGEPVAVTHSRGDIAPSLHNRDKNYEAKFLQEKNKSFKIISKNIENCKSENVAIKEWSKEANSMSEIASCSYEARKAGVCKGMYLGAAMKLCPNLKTVPYDFDGYQKVSMALYDTVAEYTLDIEAVSCDELFIDTSEVLSELNISPSQFAQILRSDIEKKTKCTSSVGIGKNKLLARLATKQAKPNNQFFISPENIENFMEKLDLNDLPGVGRKIGKELKSLNVKTCGDLQKLSLSALKKKFGAKTGKSLFNHCRGIDNNQLIFNHERKSVSTEVNYGIRFNDNNETEVFLKQLSEEVSNRLKKVKANGKNITLKLMFRAKDAPVETAKFLGHGVCDVVNKTVALPAAVNDPNIISKTVISIYRNIGIPANELRGIGIHISKLEDSNKKDKPLKEYFMPNEKFIKGENKTTITFDSTNELNSNSKILNKILRVEPSASSIKYETSLPAHIDLEVFSSLPDNIKTEVFKEYQRINLPLECNTKNIEPSMVVTNRSAEERNKNFENNQNAYHLFELSINELRLMIKEWVSSESKPETYDVNMLKIYLKYLVEEKKLETLAILLRCFQRHIKIHQKNNEVWKRAINEIFDDVKTSMLGIFGKSLGNETWFTVNFN